MPLCFGRRRNSAVSAANREGLDGPGSNPGGVRFSARVQTGPGAHPASCTMGTSTFLGKATGA
jgi:hypothetical protein